MIRTLFSLEFCKMSTVIAQNFIKNLSPVEVMILLAYQDCLEYICLYFLAYSMFYQYNFLFIHFRASENLFYIEDLSNVYENIHTDYLHWWVQFALE